LLETAAYRYSGSSLSACGPVYATVYPRRDGAFLPVVLCVSASGPVFALVHQIVMDRSSCCVVCVDVTDCNTNVISVNLNEKRVLLKCI
jgi:hypothetical protein